MKTKVMIIMVLLACICQVKAELVFDSGYNIYDESLGSHAEVEVINDATLDVLGGSITGYLLSDDISKVNLFDGNINDLWTRGNSIVKILGGQIDMLIYEDSSLIYLYAYNVTYHPIGGGDWGTSPWLEGTYLQNNKHFDFKVPGSESLTFSHIQVVPEPMTICLFGLGSLLIIRKNR